ncbi:hypothetical protein KD050_15310 [Psychrobacillus sp. INOP01]|uniref:hypothetical protein n=1 Tax=Psychrobacillus sp. INOP01 TaxID=2829187 RepID=UPI001BA8C6DE|nr:hypothetical protein [Psychrobacillus sp. INOP01]QUG40656.1 hypothetical protein KD050_15310 [Psychrobacillus sp. INOP01]
MITTELNEEFKKVLEYGYTLGNENKTIKESEFIDELSAQLKVLMDNTKKE